MISIFQQGDSTGDVSHTGRWNSLELTKGVFGPEDSVNDMAEVKFDSPVPIKVRETEECLP